MFQIDPLALIPQGLKTAARDALVDFVTDQTKKFLGDEISSKIKKLRSDASFNQKFEKGLENAIKRFVSEYVNEDEDLVIAIKADASLFQNEQVQRALLEMLKNPGRYLDSERETVAESFATVLPERRNRERVDNAVTFLLRCLAEELWNLPELQPIYSLQFQKMTAESLRQQVKIQKAQLHALTTMNEGVRQTLLQLTDAISEQKLLPTPGSVSREQNVLHNLPQPNYGQFIGRESEIEQICNILRPYPHSQSHLVTIDGIGGIGKSALALEVAQRYLRNYQQMPKDERFDAIIWISAKRSILTADGIKPRSQTLNALDDVYSAIAITLQREDITRARPDDQLEVVRQTLKRQRTLLIVDNLETVDDEAVLSFLRELPAPTKSVVTTRHRLDVAYPVRLVGMPWNDAQQLILNESERKGVHLETEHARRFYERTGGVPLALVWSIAQIGMGHNPNTVLAKLGTPSSDISKFCFEEVLSNIRNSSAYELILALGLFESSASRNALQYVTQLPELECDEGLVKLEKLSLLNKTADRFLILPLTRYFIRGEILENREFETKVASRLIQFYMNFMEKQKLGGLDALLVWETEKENISAIFEKLMIEQNHTLVSELYRQYYHFLWRRGYWAEGIKMANQILEWADSSGQRETQARFRHWLGRLYLYQGRYADAEITLAKAADSYLTTDWQWISVQTYLARVLLKQHQENEAIEILNKTLAIAMERDDFRGAARIHNVLAEAMLMKSDLDSALTHVQTGHELIYGRNEQVTVFGKNLHLRGVVELRKGNLQQAEEWVIKFKEIANREGFVTEIAQAELELAEISLCKGNYSATRAYATTAQNIFERLGMKEELEECNKLIMLANG